MKRMQLPVLLVSLTLAAVMGLSIWQSLKAPALPFSSFNTGSDGTKALYLILEDLGYQVERRTGANWNPEGVLIAIGADYLPEAAEGERVLSFDSPVHLTNGEIRDSVYDFVVEINAYRDRVIVFDEYGRTQTVQNTGGTREVFVFPMWLRLVFLSAALITATLMLFYRQRIGEALTPEAFGGRTPLEGIYAMAGRLFSAKAYRECAELYYRHSLRRMKGWDNGEIARAVQQTENERDALALLDDIDRRMEELKNESKRAVADFAK